MPQSKIISIHHQAIRGSGHNFVLGLQWQPEPELALECRLAAGLRQGLRHNLT